MFLWLFSLQNSLAFSCSHCCFFFLCCKIHIKKTDNPIPQKCMVRLGKKVIVILCRAKSSRVCWLSLFLYSRKHEILCFSSKRFQGHKKHCIGNSYERHLLECFFFFFVLKWEWGKLTHYNKPAESTVLCFKSSEGLDMYQNNLSWLKAAWVFS